MIRSIRTPRALKKPRKLADDPTRTASSQEGPAQQGAARGEAPAGSKDGAGGAAPPDRDAASRQNTDADGGRASEGTAASGASGESGFPGGDGAPGDGRSPGGDASREESRSPGQDGSPGDRRATRRRTPRGRTARPRRPRRGSSDGGQAREGGAKEDAASQGGGTGRSGPGRSQGSHGSEGSRAPEGSQDSQGGNENSRSSSRPKKPIAASLAENLRQIRQELGNPMDLKVRELRNGDGKLVAAIVHLEGMVNDDVVYNQIVKVITWELRVLDGGLPPPKEAFRRLANQLISVTEVREDQDFNQMVLEIIAGDTVVLLDSVETALICGARGWEGRRVEEPQNEAVVRGPREGFTETLKTNVSLIRRRVKDPRLRFDPIQVGERTKTSVALAYIQDIASEELVREVTGRLKAIETDAVLESGYIEEFIEDSPWSPFPQMARTERPDVVASCLLEGRVAVLVDGTPFALIAPVVFFQLLMAAEDYYERWIIGTLVRLLRMTMFLISLFLPSLYVAVTTFHPELLPTTLVLSIAAQREGVPFPAFVEAIGMEIAFEMLREAGLRLPRTIGQAVSIVGALVIGEAAVSAGLVSPAMVIVVAATGIASFSAPAYNLAISARLLRFIVLVGAASLGLFGVGIVGALIMAHLASLRSFGVPYMSPLAPFHGSDLKDIFIRTPWWSMWTRPRLTGAAQSLRQRVQSKRSESNETRD